MNSSRKNHTNAYRLFYYTTLTALLSGAAGASFPALKGESKFLPAALLITAALILAAVYIMIFQKSSRLAISRYEDDAARMNAELASREANLARLLDEYDRLSAENHQKTEFFTNLTHEMKTPLSVILGAIQLTESSLAKGCEEGRLLRHFDRIRQNSYRLIRLVNNILDISRLESGYMKLNQVNCNLVYLVEEITMSISPFAEQKDISVEFDTDEEEIITAVDPEKMERILLNLLSNAIKFSDEGGKITVYVQKRSNSAAILVKDSGPGIPEEMQDKIFERFKQVNGKMTRQSEGTGIGLAIVKAFTELQGGSISVVSKGKGSTFIVELPLQLCSGETGEKTKPDSHGRVIDNVKIELSDIYTVA